MFTGLVEAVGEVVSVKSGAGALHVTLRVPPLSGDLRVGASISVDGACLTAIEITDDGFAVQIVQATLSRTVASRYHSGSRVNLERAMRLDDRLDGHLVQGHVDGLGRLSRIQEAAEHRLLDFEIPPEVAQVTIPEGSIAVNGVSLTVQALPDPGVCQVAIIPHTWQNTNISDLRLGDSVNLEGDLIGKYVGKMLAKRAEEAQS